jgi:hypothetical protein
MQRNELTDLLGKKPQNDVPPVPVGTPRLRIMEDPSLLGTTKYLKGACQDHLRFL